MIIKTLDKVSISLIGLCLFDSDSTSRLINQQAVPPQVQALIGSDQQVTTTQDSYSAKEYFDTSKITFFYFCKTCHVPYVHLILFHSPSYCYNFIVGRDTLRYGIIIDHVRNCITWDGLLVPMTIDVRSPASSVIAITYCTCAPTLHKVYTMGITKIKEAKYEKVVPDKVIEIALTYLSTNNNH